MSANRPSHAFHRSFAEGFDPRELKVEADYLLFASAGVFELAVENRQWLLPPQRAALIPAGTPITVAGRGPAVSSSVLFHAGEAGVLGSVRVFRVNELARLMIARAMRWDGEAAATPVAGALFSALGDLVAELAAEPEETSLPRPVSSPLQRAIAAGLAELDADVPLARLAGIAAVSERTLSRLFSSELGMGWSELRQRARLIRAMELLVSGDEGIAQVGLAVGFDSTSAFVRAFRNHTGTTPHAYRRSARPNR